MTEQDYFESQIEQIICPMENLTEGVIDTTYLMRHDGSFVYTEGYYAPPGKLIGKIIYHPSPEGAIDIHGRNYMSMVKGEKNGEATYIPHDEQIRLHHRLDPTLSKDDLLITRYHVAFPLSDFTGYFDDRKSLRYAMSKFPLVGKAVENVSRFLDLPIERLGITGSTALGRRGQHSDIDLVIFGTIDENRETSARIRRHIHSHPECRVMEFGKFWPLRFFYQGIEICPAYVYRDLDQAPIRDCTIELLKDNVEVYGTVVDDTHAIYMPPVIPLGDVWLDDERADDLTLIIYDGSVRGEFYKDERLHLHGRCVRITKGDKSFTAVTVFDAGDIRKEHFAKGAPQLKREIRKIN